MIIFCQNFKKSCRKVGVIFSLLRLLFALKRPLLSLKFTKSTAASSVISKMHKNANFFVKVWYILNWQHWTTRTNCTTRTNFINKTRRIRNSCSTWWGFSYTKCMRFHMMCGLQTWDPWFEEKLMPVTLLLFLIFLATTFNPQKCMHSRI